MHRLAQMLVEECSGLGDHLAGRSMGAGHRAVRATTVARRPAKRASDAGIVPICLDQDVSTVLGDEQVGAEVAGVKCDEH